MFLFYTYMIKKLLPLLLVVLLASIVLGEDSNLPNTKTVLLPNLLNTDQNNLGDSNDESLLRCVEIEREILEQKRGTYDSSLMTLQFVIAFFSATITIIIISFGIILYRNINEFKKELREEFIQGTKPIIENIGKSEFQAQIDSINEDLSNLRGEIVKTQTIMDKLRMTSKLEQKEDKTLIDIIKKQPKKEKNIFD